MTDPKIKSILDWLLPLLHAHAGRSRPFVVGLSGVQGSGKSTLVQLLQTSLISSGIRTAQLSLDDLYLTRADQQAVIERYPDNALLGSRGQFGTHDLALADQVLAQLGVAENERSTFEPSTSTADVMPARTRQVRLPHYDKSCFDGLGDRSEPNAWPLVRLPVDCLILEGWGVGFRALGVQATTARWQEARAAFAAAGKQASELRRHDLHHVLQIDGALASYEQAFLGPHTYIEALVVLRPERIEYVYDWRLEQERVLRRTRPGMTDEQVIAFVDRYYPAYELYFGAMCDGFFDGEEDHGRQLNLLIDRQRKLIKAETK